MRAYLGKVGDRSEMHLLYSFFPCNVYISLFSSFSYSQFTYSLFGNVPSMAHSLQLIQDIKGHFGDDSLKKS